LREFLRLLKLLLIPVLDCLEQPAENPVVQGKISSMMVAASNDECGQSRVTPLWFELGQVRWRPRSSFANHLE
jgi:hypothetical protein